MRRRQITEFSTKHSHLLECMYLIYLLMHCRLSRPDLAQSDWNLSQSVGSSAPSSTYSRSASRPRDLQPVSRPTVRAPCQPQPPHQTAVRDAFSRQHQLTAPSRPSQNGGPRPADWNGSLGCERRTSASHAYDSCVAAITRGQVDCLMNRCHRPHRTAAAAAPNIRQNPTVV